MKSNSSETAETNKAPSQTEENQSHSTKGLMLSEQLWPDEQSEANTQVNKWNTRRKPASALGSKIVVCSSFSIINKGHAKMNFKHQSSALRRSSGKSFKERSRKILLIQSAANCNEQVKFLATRGPKRAKMVHIAQSKMQQRGQSSHGNACSTTSQHWDAKNDLVTQNKIVQTGKMHV